MTKFWKEHAQLRMILILASFVVGLVLIWVGWKTMPGKLAGLGVMAVGLALLLVALDIYNKPFQDPPKKKSR